VNPNVDARTHKYTTTGKRENKFGLDVRLVPRIFEAWRGDPNLSLAGLHFHLGSPIATPSPYVEALEVVLRTIDELERAGHAISVLNIGGGFGIEYGHEQQSVATPEEFAAAIVPVLCPRVGRGLRIHMEPGRVLVGDAGLLVTRVQYVKETTAKAFAICDAGMHTLIRPALYGSYHFAWPVAPGTGFVPRGKGPVQVHQGLRTMDLVGPICESSDFLVQDRLLPPLAPGDLIAVFDSGAYGMSMASTYNDQPRPAEVLVRGSESRIIMPRQSVADLLGLDQTAPGV
jgi:diaminopimelate decarboxylase